MSKKQNQKQEQDKPRTRYDRKMEARRKQAAKEKRESLIGKILVIIVSVGIIGTAGYFIADHFIKLHKITNDPYLAVGNHTVSQLEYEYYYNSTVNNYISTYSYFLSYMGLDTTLPYDEQDYSEDMTWQDYFEEMTIDQLKQEFALTDDAAANNFEYDTTDEYNEYVSSTKETVKANNTNMRTYIKDAFGEYATVRNIKPFMERTFTASAYYEKLLEDNAPSDEEVNDYYIENQNSYDMVSYYSFEFDDASYISEDGEGTETEGTEDESTEAPEDTDTEGTEAESTEAPEDTDTESTEAPEDADTEGTETESTETPDNEDTANESQAYKDAQAMLERVKNGEDFESLCYEYATDDMKEQYAGVDEYSLSSDVTADSIDYQLVSWLYDDARKAGDVTVISNEELGVYYVVKFVEKKYDDECLDNISSTLSSDKADAYLEDLTTNYTINDIKGEIGYLQLNLSDDEDTE